MSGVVQELTHAHYFFFTASTIGNATSLSAIQECWSSATSMAFYCSTRPPIKWM